MRFTIVANFEHIATRIPHNVKLTFKQNILFRLGFKDKVIDEVMDDWDISEYEYFYEGVTYA
tara:strand:- start:252 stop:437 length:186 start_codon:yes stop_codon:yes gene_type:complete